MQNSLAKRIVCIGLCLLAFFARFGAFADEERVFILCNPKTSVNVRKTPKTKSEITGRLEFGDWVNTDREEKNGFLHVYGITEDGEGWVFAGYVVDDEPIRTVNTRANINASGRVMAYRWIDGKRNCWLKVSERVTVYGISSEWSVTNRGYIRTKYLEVNYE